MDDFDHLYQDRIREKAHRIWQQEGCPHGRDREHWQMARELVAIELNQKLATKPIDAGRIGPEGEPIEEASVQDNLGEFPTLTDQGEQQSPHRRSEDGARERRSEDGARERRSEDGARERSTEQAAAAPKRARATTRGKKDA